jgi:hypothetical protein
MGTGGKEMHVKFVSRNVKERENLQCLGVDGGLVLISVLRIG